MIDAGLESLVGLSNPRLDSRAFGVLYTNADILSRKPPSRWMQSVYAGVIVIDRGCFDKSHNRNPTSIIVGWHRLSHH